MIDTPAPEALRRVPPELDAAVSLRAAWSQCAMERSRFGPIHIDDPGMPFHHLGLVLAGEPTRMATRIDGRLETTTMGPGKVSAIAAGNAGISAWHGPLEMACFYFTDAALAAALGREVGRHHAIRSSLLGASPIVALLLRALHDDAMAGQPHGRLRGDALFLALAGQLVLPSARSHEPLVASVADRRVRHALAYIHAHLADALTVEAIAFAAATSPFHLARCFRAALGCTLWQYVLRERARHAARLMQHRPRLALARIADESGFDTYASFVAATRAVFGVAPARLKASFDCDRRHG